MGIVMLNLDRLVNQYNKLFDDKINPYSWSTVKAQKILEWCDKSRNTILMESNFNTYNNNSEYARILILETISRRILTEIAPKRMRKGKKNYAKK